MFGRFPREGRRGREERWGQNYEKQPPPPPPGFWSDRAVTGLSHSVLLPSLYLPPPPDTSSSRGPSSGGFCFLGKKKQSPPHSSSRAPTSPEESPPHSLTEIPSFSSSRLSRGCQDPIMPHTQWDGSGASETQLNCRHTGCEQTWPCYILPVWPEQLSQPL